MLTPKNVRSNFLTERITIKVHPSQKQRFQEQAEAAGMTESEYGRSLLFSGARQTDDQMLRNIGNICGLIAQKVGISVEQLAAIVKGKA